MLKTIIILVFHSELSGSLAGIYTKSKSFISSPQNCVLQCKDSFARAKQKKKKLPEQRFIMISL